MTIKCHPGLVPGPVILAKARISLRLSPVAVTLASVLGSAYTVLLTYTELLAFLTPNQIFLQLTIVSFLFLDCFVIKMYLFRNI